MTDPWAAPPPSTDRTPWPAFPVPPSERPWTARAAGAGVPLAVAVALTLTTVWGVVQALIFSVVATAVGNDPALDEFDVKAPGMAARLWPLVAVLTLALLAAVAWAVFAVVQRRRRLGAAALLPYGIVTGLVFAVGGFFAASVWFSLVDGLLT
jgi:uncharacterized BrkB/YihY/UPF0761 family membrane protein